MHEIRLPVIIVNVFISFNFWLNTKKILTSKLGKNLNIVYTFIRYTFKNFFSFTFLFFKKIILWKAAIFMKFHFHFFRYKSRDIFTIETFGFTY